MPNRAATDKQCDYIESLATNLGLEYHDVREIAESLGIKFSGGYTNLTLNQASTIISTLATRKEGF